MTCNDFGAPNPESDSDGHEERRPRSLIASAAVSGFSAPTGAQHELAPAAVATSPWSKLWTAWNSPSATSTKINLSASTSAH